MIRYILHRIFMIIPILLCASFLIFFLLRTNSTDPVSQYLINSNLPQTPELVATIRHEFGLDKPLLTQYVLWLQKAVQFDFGKSYTTQNDVWQDFLYYVPNTLLLASFAFLFTLFVSIPLGIMAAYYKDRIPDILIRFVCFLGVCMPNFWLAFLLILLFSLTLGWLPALGVEGLHSFIMPAMSIAFMAICMNIRLIRHSSLEVAKERHVLYARLRGLQKKYIAIKHIFYNAMLPVITLLGMYFGELIGGALLIESIFAIPGIGYYSVQGIANHDYPVIQCFVLVMCFVFCVCNLCVDIICAMLDPRIRKNVAHSSVL